MEPSHTDDNICELVREPPLDLLGLNIDMEVERDNSVFLTQA